MFKLIGKEDRKISNWSGGVTQQLYIYPEDSEYANRDFKFRISVATTEVESSQFTKLYDTNRVISILDGKMELEHRGHYKKTLNKYEIDRFSGEWDTFSKGKVRDFNLMIKGTTGDFYYKEITKDIKLDFVEESSFKFVFCITGDIVVNKENVKKEELIVIEKDDLHISGEGKVFYGYIK